MQERLFNMIEDDYLKGEFDKVEIIYNEFKSVIQQRIVVEQILPIPPEQIQKTKDVHALAQVDYIYEPSSSEIINVLLPKHLNFLIWHFAGIQHCRRRCTDDSDE